MDRLHLAKARRIWAAAFDGAQARIFAYDRATGRLSQLDIGPGAGARKPDYRDRPGTTHQSVGEARGFGAEPSHAEHALERAFVLEVTAALAAEAIAQRFDALVVAAPARALGAFRKNAPEALQARIAAEIRADHVNTPILEFQDAVRASLET